MSEPTMITIPELAVVALVGASGSGKSSFARTHFADSEVLSSDACRKLVSDDENSQEATGDAFDVLYYIAAKRLARGKLVVIDATNLKSQDRAAIVSLAREHHVIPCAIVLDMPESLCKERNRQRTDRDFGPHVIPQQIGLLRKGFRTLKREGFRNITILSSPQDVEAATITRQPLWNNKKHVAGPFDIIGDVHGCYDELTELLAKLGWVVDVEACTATPPDGRTAIFVGDYVDRGPRTPDVLRLVMNMADAGTAICVPGNHDAKLARKLGGRDVKVAFGLAETLAQLEHETPEFHERVRAFLDGLVSHYVLDGGNLVVAHAGMAEAMQGRGSGRVREFALYGETTGETDEYGLPVRYNWAADYRGAAHVIYGHTPVAAPEWLNRTINIDTGCVFGGSLTALRYPERELVSVPAHRVYYESLKPFLQPADVPAPVRPDDVLDLADVTGKRIVDTRLRHNVTIEAANAVTALEVMSRFAANPRWLIYLPPTMSPSETSQLPGRLESPAEAFDYFRSQGVAEVVCEEKHMGSRAVVIVCRDIEVAKRRFKIAEDELGIVYTRTGRRFFDRDELEAAFLRRVHAAMEASGLWDELATDWVCLDCEIMPWSTKAQKLIEEQYAAVGAAARGSLADVLNTLRVSAERGVVGHELVERYEERSRLAERFTDAYRHYCWPVAGLDDIKLAPFHVLATEGAVHVDKNHIWHMETIAKLCAADAGWFVATPYRRVDLSDDAAVADASAWWEQLTSTGGEGMVIKPLDFITRGRKGLVQPAVKCRGPEYLRIIYGPEYTLPENLERLRDRGVGRKRSLAMREFALGVESLERFVAGEPLYRVHECVFGVLALESEPTDPRL